MEFSVWKLVLPCNDNDFVAKRVTRQSTHGKLVEDSPGMIMYSKRILFTYQSPYINSSVDITEYDKVFVYSFCYP